MADLKSIQGTRTNNKKIIMGDFNINILNKNHQTISNLCNDLNTKQLINTATTKQNTMIDHIYTNITNTKLSGVIILTMTKFSFNSDTIEMQSVVKQSKPPIDKKLSKSIKFTKCKSLKSRKFKRETIKKNITTKLLTIARTIN